MTGQNIERKCDPIYAQARLTDRTPWKKDRRNEFLFGNEERMDALPALPPFPVARVHGFRLGNRL
jgi:hypothetical protein